MQGGSPAVQNNSVGAPLSQGSLPSSVSPSSMIGGGFTSSLRAPSGSLIGVMPPPSIVNSQPSSLTMSQVSAASTSFQASNYTDAKFQVSAYIASTPKSGHKHLLSQGVSPYDDYSSRQLSSCTSHSGYPTPQQQGAGRGVPAGGGFGGYFIHPSSDYCNQQSPPGIHKHLPRSTGQIHAHTRLPFSQPSSQGTCRSTASEIKHATHANTLYEAAAQSYAANYNNTPSASSGRPSHTSPGGLMSNMPPPMMMDAFSSVPSDVGNPELPRSSSNVQQHSATVMYSRPGLVSDASLTVPSSEIRPLEFSDCSADLMTESELENATLALLETVHVPR